MTDLPEWIAKRIKTDPDHLGCWLWPRVNHGNGYGESHGIVGAKSRIAHRAVWLELVGPIPDGMELDHLCLVRACVNPDHLEPVTHAENLMRSPTVGRTRKPTHCPNGHPYGEVRVQMPNRRRCMTCMKEAKRRNNAAAYARRRNHQ